MSLLPLSRRTLLRGAGAAVGLPWLEAMAAPRGPAAKAPIRMAALYMPNGVREDMWTPKGEGRDFELSPTLSPLQDVKDYLIVPTNLWNPASVGGDGHYVKISGWLTCTTVTKTLGVDVSCNGVSIDQLAAQRAGRATPIPSMELAVSPVTTGVDKNVGYTRVYGSHISWAGPTAPLARELNPQLAFERLFRAGRGQDNAAKDDLQLLDRVLEDARGLRTKLGTNDKHRLDEYLSVIRSLEDRLQRAANPEKSKWKPRAALDPSAKPAANPKDFADHVKLMFDIITLAFRTDSTRIGSFVMAHDGSNRPYPNIGVKEGHHDLSHHESNADKMEKIAKINVFHMQLFAAWLKQLQETRESDGGSLLDHSMIVYGSAIEDGMSHAHHDLPVLLAGRGGGTLRSGRHIRYAKNTPMANLFLSMLDRMGAPAERFGDSTGRLDQLA